MTELTEIETAADATRAAVEEARRSLPILAEMAPELAKIKRQLYESYLDAGFSEAQALELCKSLT